MSNYADPNKAYVWMDGDAFRGKAGAKLPTDPFAAKLADFDAFGGIEAGFEETADQSVDKKKVWNYRQSAYKVTRDPLESGIKFRAVDNSKATLLTRAQGGKITKLGENYGMERGLGEEFSLLVRLDDGEDKTAIFCERATLAGPPVRAALDGTNIDGWEFDVTFLAKPIEILPGLPEGIEAPQQ
ncbi:hypothetical protein [Corynebacterium renale]|uniref:Uncharacterized protein n=1 Tax=Corynebacterium renale TaxID=1724 RepID=A0A2A9DKY2_9CORY|nr:hypothetical protein [Corynebacterium renale]PFG27397.1 hypothetical protein ATK06_0453 [Corynebacterium renale]SQI23516.1 Uncharacterised protein [Corynebacterium renale]